MTSQTDDISAEAAELVVSICALTDRLDAGEGDAAPAVARTEAAADLAAAVARLHHVADQLQVLAAHLVVSESCHRQDAERSSRRWLSRHTGVSFREASANCRAAATLDLYPEAAAAFRAGDLTAGHLDSISRIIPQRLKGAELDDAVAQVREVEDVIVETGRRTTVDEFAQFCARIRQRLDQDGPGDRAGEPSRVWLRRLFNGRWELTGDLSADDGALLATILADLAATERAARAAEATDGGSGYDDADGGGASADRPTDNSQSGSPSAASAQDHESNGEGHMAGEEHSATTENPAGTTHAAERTARSLLGLIADGAGAAQPGRVGIFLHIDLDDLGLGDEVRSLLAESDTDHTEAGLDISDDSLWALMAGADVTPTFTLDGSPLSYGRTRRLAPPILRRILAHRDRRCRFPGCDRPPIDCEIHHITFWEHGGTTDPQNCVGLCSYHHRRVIHADGFSLTGDPKVPDRLITCRPDGSVLDLTPRFRRQPVTYPSRGRG